jgi:hypothetical protein
MKQQTNFSHINPGENCETQKNNISADASIIPQLSTYESERCADELFFSLS